MGEKGTGDDDPGARQGTPHSREKTPNTAPLLAEIVVVVLIAAAGFVVNSRLMYLFAIRPFRRSLSARSGALADVVDEGLAQMDRHFDKIDQILARMEWSSRLLRRELRKSR
jgi:hypothetical protein